MGQINNKVSSGTTFTCFNRWAMPMKTWISTSLLPVDENQRRPDNTMKKGQKDKQWPTKHYTGKKVE